jgi:bifunctional NMN adenylyltransferase/nudix hydrolase
MSFEQDEVVGVVVARFQVPALHEGHRYILEYVLERHKTALVILGCSPIMTDRNPLSFEIRQGMIESAYPQKFTIVSSDSLPSSYEERSRRIDEVIRNKFPNRQAVIYGSRDSFVHTYRGVFETHEVPTVFSGSATEIREKVDVIDSVDFRSGIIYANLHRKRVGYPTVDVAILDSTSEQVLLVGKKDEEGKLRFPGVFFDPELDDSYESAGVRCIAKEVPGIIVEPMQIARSLRINDWRFRKTHDQVVTILLKTTYVSGEVVLGSGVDSLQWINLDDLSKIIVNCHKPLVELLKQ